jgi:hypothetical protein
LAAFALLSTAALVKPAPVLAKTAFDGTWSVLIVTEKGECDRGFRYPVEISGSHVGYAGQASFNVSGKVAASGAISVTVSRGDKSAKGTGVLAGSRGSGSWAGGPCSGTWTAERRS